MSDFSFLKSVLQEADKAPGSEEKVSKEIHDQEASGFSEKFQKQFDKMAQTIVSKSFSDNVSHGGDAALDHYDELLDSIKSLHDLICPDIELEIDNGKDESDHDELEKDEEDGEEESEDDPKGGDNVGLQTLAGPAQPLVEKEGIKEIKDVIDVVPTDLMQALLDTAEANELLYGGEDVDYDGSSGFKLDMLGESELYLHFEESFDFEGEDIPFDLILEKAELDKFMAGAYLTKNDMLVQLYTIVDADDEILPQIKSQFERFTGEDLDEHPDFEEYVSEALIDYPLYALVCLNNEGETTSVGLTYKQASQMVKLMQKEIFVFNKLSDLFKN